MEHAEEHVSARGWWGDTIRFTLIAVAAVFILRYFILQPFIVSGSSMEPTFENAEYLIIDELSYQLRAPERGEVVIVRFLRDEVNRFGIHPRFYFIKRLIGLPGETVAIRDGKVYITPAGGGIERELNETYLPSLPAATLPASFELGPDDYFVMGDNRGASLDSRIIGPVHREALVGRPLVRLWPPERISALPGFFSFK